MAEWGKLRINLKIAGFWAKNQTRDTSNIKTGTLTTQKFWYVKWFRPFWVSRLKLCMYISSH
jgi:hypothetical protein